MVRDARRAFGRSIIPDRLRDVDLYEAAPMPSIEIELAAKPEFERIVGYGEKNRSTRHFIWRPSLEVQLDFHLSVSPFHSEGGAGYELLMQRRIRNAHGLWVLSPEDDYGMALIEALIEALANRLRRLWDFDVLTSGSNLASGSGCAATLGRALGASPATSCSSAHPGPVIPGVFWCVMAV